MAYSTNKYLRVRHYPLLREINTQGAIAWAIDLTPLIKDENLPLMDYTLDLIERFRTDVENRIKKFL